MTVHLSTLSSTGTEGTPTGSGDRYVSMVTWEAAAQGQHLAGDQTILEVYKGTTVEGGWQADGSLDINLYFDGWAALSESDDVTIRAADGNAHGGVWGAGCKLNAGVFRFYQSWVTLEDLEVETDLLLHLRSADEGVFNIRRLLSKATSGTNMENRQYNNIAKIENCVFVNASNSAIVNVLNTAGSYVKNCTFARSAATASAGLSGVANPTDLVNFENNVVVNNLTDYDKIYDNGLNNASGDTTAPSPGAQHNVSIADGVDFVSPSTDDYRPQPSGKLDGTGTDQSQTFTDDITGQTRTQWDIGAYGIISAGGVTFDGPDIVAQTGTENTLFSFNENGEGTVASRFTGATSYALSPDSDALPAGLTVNATTGNIEGTPTEVVTRSIIIRGSE